MRPLLTIVVALCSMTSSAQSKDSTTSSNTRIFSAFAHHLPFFYGSGAGLTYETSFDKVNQLSFETALYFVNDHAPYRTVSTLYLFSPGIKYHLGKQKINSHYSLGGYLILGIAKGEIAKQPRFVRGLAVSNSYNIQYSKHFRSLIELQLGTTIDNYDTWPKAFIKPSISFGYCW